QTSYQLHPSSFNGMSLARIYSGLRDPRVLTLCDEMLRQPLGEPLVDLLYLKGIYYSDQKNYRKALPLFEACLAQDWKFTDAHLEIGLIYFEQQLYPKALKTFERAATTNLTSADAYYWIGRCYQQLQQKDTAAQYYQKALAFDPTFIEAREKLQELRVQKESR
ncbi:MAG: tetratricopeptide repeat protein, partial [Chitinophagaceae bacterium]